MTSEQGLLKSSRLRWWAPRLSAGAVGLILLTAALLKATDMELFIRQIRDYGIISQRVALTLSAWSLIALECALGVGLMVFYRPRLILSATGGLLLIFLGVTGWAWMTGATEDCGCFGAWMRHTPGEAAIQNLVLLVATLLAWVGPWRLETQHTRARAWAFASACAIGLTLPIAFGFPISGITQPHSNAVEIELANLQIQGLGDIDLKHGAYLIILTDTECLHCGEAVPGINALAEATELPAVIALCTNEESQRMMFVEEFEPMFLLGQVREDVFWRMLADGDIPRIILVQDGRVQQVWDQTVPDEDSVRAKYRF